MDQMRKNGTPVKIDGPPLTLEQLAAAIAYGSHNSCNRDPSFLRTGMREFVEKGFWIVLPLEDEVGLNGLHLSPAGLIPQRDRRDHIVIDYTWSGVNEATHCLSPDSMQFGHALQRILQQIRCGHASRANLHDESRHRGWLLLRGSGPRGCTFSKGMTPPGAGQKNSSRIPPRPSNGLGGIPATILCCDRNRGRSCQHCIEGENSAAANAAST